jgi:WD repeat-containing protein 11
MLKLQVTGLLHGISGSLQSIRMCPALTTRNWQEYEPLMAGGTESGCVQVYNMATGIMEKELVIHSYPVRLAVAQILKNAIFEYLNFQRH